MAGSTQGETIGGSNDSIYREMIRETIREHLRKESMLRPHGIKVLSLFFVDKVASFLGDGYDNNTADGDFVKWFDEVFREERDKSQQWARSCCRGDPSRLPPRLLLGPQGQEGPEGHLQGHQRCHERPTTTPTS